MRHALLAAVAASWMCAGDAFADPVAVRFPEGSLHGFLSLRGPDGRTLASGDLLQTVAAGRVTAKLVFTFRDGPAQRRETAVFSQRGHFKLIADHLVQKGPAFPRPLDLAIDGATGEVTVRYTNDHGEEKVESERMELPADLANGLITTLLKNLRAASTATLSMVAATPKPRLVKLKITAAGRDSLSIGGVAASRGALRVEGGHRRHRRGGCADHRQAAAGLPRLDPAGGSPSRSSDRSRRCSRTGRSGRSI